MLKQILYLTALLLVFSAACYPWLFMEPNYLRLISLVILVPAAPIFMYILWTGDFTPLKWAAKKFGIVK